MTMPETKKKVYSKNGCRECKRRKIKCDEGKPECIQCSRLGKVCDYPKIGEKVLRVSKKYLIDNPGYNQRPPEKRSKKEFILVKDKPSRYKTGPSGPDDGKDLSTANPVASLNQSSNQPQISSNQQSSSSLGSSVPASSSSNTSNTSNTPKTASSSHSQKAESTTYPPLMAHGKSTTAQNPQDYHQQTSSLQNPQYLQTHLGQYPSPYVLQSPAGSGAQRLPQQYPPPYPYPYQPPHGLPHQPYIQLQMQTQYPPSTYRNANQNMPPDPNVIAPGSTVPTTFPSSLPLLSVYNNPSPHGKLPGHNQVAMQSPPGTSPDAQVSTRNTSPMSKISNSPNPNGVSGGHNNPESASHDMHMNNSAEVDTASVPHGSSSNLDSNDELIKNDILFENFFNREDLNLLAGDLNNLVGTMMFESNFERKNGNELGSLETSSTKHLASPSIPSIKSMDSNINGRNNKDRNIPFDYIKLKTTQERYYLEQFYNEFAKIILPFNPYDESCGGYFNPARDVLMKSASKEPFLLAAILAQGAKIAFNKNNLPQDEEFYCNYLSKCLKLLGPALSGNNDKKKRKNLASNIESVLLTVLLLTSANASNIKQDWRPHLRGAKDLLLKYALHLNNLKESKILIFCKLWFISFELLAALSSQKGGTLQTENEIDSLMKIDDTFEVQALQETGVVTENGFNYMFGFYQGLLPSLKDLIKFLNKIRDSGSENTDAFECMRLLSEYQRCSEVVFVNKKLYLKPDDFPNSSVPEGLWLDIQTDSTIINWLDISQQSYCLAGMLTVLTKGFGLSYTNAQVKQVTERLINLMEILKDIPNITYRGCGPLMIQWPMLVGGLNCTEESQKNIVQQFFKISGSGSASFSIQIIDKVWNRRHNSNGEDYESGSDVDIDLVTY